jgi:NADH-quinone oxidoreductase subunit J
MDLSTISFLILGVLACVLTGVMITRRWPVSAAMLLIAIFALLAGMYGLLDAHFAAAAQIIVYAGAIMVVFVFVIMLLNIPPEELRYGRVTLMEWVLTAMGVLAALWFGTRIGQGYLGSIAEHLVPGLGRKPFFPEHENVKNVAALMFTDYLWSFELISFLILAAVVGSIVIAKKRSHNVKPA